MRNLVKTFRFKKSDRGIIIRAEKFCKQFNVSFSELVCNALRLYFEIYKTPDPKIWIRALDDDE